MKPFSQTHLILLFLTVIFIALTMYLCSRLPRRGQYIMFALGAAFCAGGVFWRYAMGMTLSGGLALDTLMIQQLQVCNFNFILVLLMMIPKLEIARQYSLMFSMFAASTVMLSFPSSFADSSWYDPSFLNFWFNHVFAIALPLWMLASGRLKPQKKYALPVAGCVIAYFLIVYGMTEWLTAAGVLTGGKTFSYVYDPGGVILLEWLYKLIPTPCFYLAPLIAPMVGFFYLLARIFKNYRTVPYLSRLSVAEAIKAEEAEEAPDPQ